MIFFFKKKTIHLDCFTDRTDIYNYWPIQKTTKFYPNWWRNLEDSHIKPNGDWVSTMKNCTGVTDFYRYGVTLPLWCDLKINLGESADNGGIGWYFADEKSTALVHPNFQFYGFAPDIELQHFKIGVLWFFRTKEDVNWVFVENTWSTGQMNKFCIPPGILNFKYHSSINTNLFFMYDGKEKSFILENGTPLANLIPMSDSKVIIHNHLISTAEFNQKNDIENTVSFSNRYLTKRRLAKKRESEKKCPFSFGN